MIDPALLDRHQGFSQGFDDGGKEKIPSALYQVGLLRPLPNGKDRPSDRFEQGAHPLQVRNLAPDYQDEPADRRCAGTAEERNCKMVLPALRMEPGGLGRQGHANRAAADVRSSFREDREQPMISQTYRAHRGIIREHAENHFSTRELLEIAGDRRSPPEKRHRRGGSLIEKFQVDSGVEDAGDYSRTHLSQTHKADLTPRGLERSCCFARPVDEIAANVPLRREDSKEDWPSSSRMQHIPSEEDAMQESPPRRSRRSHFTKIDFSVSQPLRYLEEGSSSSPSLSSRSERS
ncbi:hypothetical protein MAMC_00693 [Methylacidimicrobium cyclopophantes]|uniref:Uncharacterized protein n=1 Tax=Methylacidimicrobium cyclopophantes TaxID=1041766 RepID=A0A5E6MJ98_9BACT|nr:hypothetical protein MAMC_00693 [Methylacidimicrobium cyclopophantes]